MGAAVGARPLVGAAVGLWRPLIVGANVGAVVGARHAGEALGKRMTARDKSTAKGRARFFAVLRGSPALFCGAELIEWTTVEVCVMVDDRRVCAKREHRHGLHCTHSMQVKCRCAHAIDEK